MLQGFYAGLSSQAAPVIISISCILFLGFFMTRLTKLVRLPNVTAYILAGIIIGPYALDLIPAEFIAGTSFLPDIALAFIAFSTGEFFRRSVLKKNGLRVVLIAFCETCLASVLVFVLCRFALRLNIVFSVVLAALAAATAPTSTIMTIRQTGAKGDFVNTLLQLVALDDIIALVLYSVAISVTVALTTGSRIDTASILTPVVSNIGVLALGAVFGFFLKLLMPKKRTTDNRLIVSIAMLFTFCGVCALLDISPLLGCMSMGMVYINLTDDDRLFKQLNYFSPPILLIFFVRSGVSFRLDALAKTSASVGAVPLLVISASYALVRILGKYAGTFLGCLYTGKPKNIRNYLGLALVPQASVAIGLAALGARMLGGEAGESLNTIILASSVMYELIGPACSKLALYLSGSYSNQLEDLVPDEALAPAQEPRTELELLIERIQKIQAELPAHNHDVSEEEAFDQAAYEYSELMGFGFRRRFTRR